jgi:hypothetical protein
MGREGRLASGVLLLILAGVLAVVGNQAPDPVISPLVLPGVFGVPGLLLLVAGLLPPRSRRASMEFGRSGEEIEAAMSCTT